MEKCWEKRGCDDEMQGRCPHNVPGGPCPADCHYAACVRKTHVVCDDFDLLLNPDRDYDAAIKQVCRFCTHFLTHGPSVGERGEAGRTIAGKPADSTGFVITPNRFIL